MYCHGVRLVALLESLITCRPQLRAWLQGPRPQSGGEHVVYLDTAISFGVIAGRLRGDSQSSLPPVTWRVLGAMPHRPVVHTDSGCSAWDWTTGLQGIACTWPKQQQTNKQLSDSQKLPPCLQCRECFVDTMFGQHPCGFCCCCSFFLSGWVLFSLVLQVKKLVAVGQSCWSVSFLHGAAHDSNTRESGLAAWWHLQPQNERCQLIKVHMSPGEIESLVNNFSLCNNWYKTVVLESLLIWLHSLVCQIHNKQMSQLVAYSSNICVWVVSCNECGGWQFGQRSASIKKAMIPMATFMKESRSNVVGSQ